MLSVEILPDYVVENLDDELKHIILESCDKKESSVKDQDYTQSPPSQTKPHCEKRKNYYLLN